MKATAVARDAFFRLEADELHEVGAKESPAKKNQRLCRPPTIIGVLALAGEIIADFLKIYPAKWQRRSCRWVQQVSDNITNDAHHFDILLPRPRLSLSTGS